MVNTAKELGIKIKAIRLLTRAEFFAHRDRIPELCNSLYWWLADVDENDSEYIAYVEGDYTEEELFCPKEEGMTYLRAALEIKAKDADVGKEFVHCGYVFTVLSPGLAISNNVQGQCKYYDEDMLDYIYSDIGTNTIFAVVHDYFGESVPVTV